MWLIGLFLGLSLAVMRHLVEGSPQPQQSQIRFFNYTDKQILDYLLDPVRYDYRVRPDEQTQINVSVVLLTLSSPDESSLKYEIEFLLHQKWQDKRLKFDDNQKHIHLNGLHHESKIWKPDIYFLKHGEFKTPLLPVHMSLKLFQNGTVHYTLRRHIALVCQGNLKIFPFDNPKCPFAVESMAYEETQLKINWSATEPEIDRATSLRTHNAYLAKYEAGECDTRHTWRGNFSCLRVLLIFTRDKSFYISTVFVPGMVLVTSSFISFWLDINAVPARVMIGVTTMLNFCTTTNSFRSTLPVVSNLTAMNLWDGVCMFFIYASMLEFIIVNYLYRNLGQSSRPSSAGHTESHRAQPLLARRAQDFEMVRKGKWSQVAQMEGSNHKRAASEHDINSLSQPGPGSGGTEISGFDDSGAGGGAAAGAGAAGLNNGFQSDRVRAVASVFAWLRRPQLFPAELPPRPRIAKAIDYFSRTVFPVLFGCFTFGFFLAYAVIEPAAEDNWRLIESQP